jgi:cytochrome c biogenesis protein CcdA
MQENTIDVIGAFVLALVFFTFGLLGAGLGTALQVFGVETKFAYLVSTTVTVVLGWLLLDFLASEEL